MDILRNKIQTIKQRPGLYLGKKSLHLLQAYLNGYLDYYNETNEPNYFFLPEFREYIQQRYNINTPSLNWTDIIILHAESEADAFDKFFQLLDEFFADNAQL
jgi:hypothetical protein